MSWPRSCLVVRRTRDLFCSAPSPSSRSSRTTRLRISRSGLSRSCLRSKPSKNSALLTISSNRSAREPTGSSASGNSLPRAMDCNPTSQRKNLRRPHDETTRVDPTMRRFILTLILLYPYADLVCFFLFLFVLVHLRFFVSAVAFVEVTFAALYGIWREFCFAHHVHGC